MQRKAKNSISIICYLVAMFAISSCNSGNNTDSSPEEKVSIDSDLILYDTASDLPKNAGGLGIREIKLYNYFTSIERYLKNEQGLPEPEINSRMQFFIGEGAIAPPYIYIDTVNFSPLEVDYRSYKAYRDTVPIDTFREIEITISGSR